MIQEDGQGEQELPGPAGDLQGFRRPVSWNCKCIHTISRQLGNSDCSHGGLGPELQCPLPGTAENRIGCGEPVHVLERDVPAAADGCPEAGA